MDEFKMVEVNLEDLHVLEEGTNSGIAGSVCPVGGVICGGFRCGIACLGCVCY